MAAWRRLLARCGRKPTRKRVHALRVVTLRELAEVENWIAGQSADSAEAKPAARWAKQAEKLREALGPVRETDVWLQKIDGLRADVSAPAGGYHPQSSQNCLRQLEKLENSLKEERRSTEKELTETIEDRRGKLEKLGQEIEESWRQQRPRTEDTTQILQKFADVAAQFSELNAGNLHDFRKGIKTVRYLAEIGAAKDREIGKLAAQLKKMQSAIGEWHDWEALAKKARRGGRRKKDDLADLLETLAGESLEKALEVCGRISEKLLKQNARGGAAPLRELEKKPVQKAMPGVTLDQSRMA